VPRSPPEAMKIGVIPAEAGIHRLPDQRRAPAFAEATTVVFFIPLGGSQAHVHSE